MRASALKSLLLLAVLVAAGLLTGCAHDDDIQNASVRPWNAPRGWETGFPSSLTEGR